MCRVRFYLVFLIFAFQIKTFGQINLCDKISQSDLAVTDYILSSGGQTIKAMDFVDNKIKFTLGLNQKYRVQYISTNDVNFQTQEKIKVNQSFFEIKDLLATLKVKREAGWATYYELPSGWSIAFDFKSNISDSSRVLFIFKRSKEQCK
jgi:maltose-binding protein MalE